MSMMYILEGHEPVPCDDVLEWATFWEQTEARRVGLAALANPIDGSIIRVSTVFLGIDHGLFGEGAPVLFETLVEGTGPYDGAMNRYTSWDSAEKGHIDTVADISDWIANYTPPEPPPPPPLINHDYRRKPRVRRK